MERDRVRFLAPSGFFALLLTAPILVLYMLRLRRRDVTVPSLLLWDTVLGDRHANRPWQKLRRNWLLFLQLLILLAMVLALTRPAIPAPLAVHGQIIILLDASASMQAQVGDTTRFAVAVREVHALASALDAGDRVSLIAVGPMPRLLLQGGDASALRLALDSDLLGEDMPFDAPADWQAAAALAVGLASGDTVTTLIVTDAAIDAELPALPGTVRFIGVGDAVANVGIVAFALRRAGEDLTAFVRLHNAGPDTTRTVALYADGVFVERRFVSLPAESDISLTVSGIPVTAWAEARLEEPDALTVDNHAWVALSGAESAHVLLVTPGNRFLSQALSVLPDLTLTQSIELLPVAAVTETVPPPYDLIVVDGPVTTTLPTTNLWLIVPGEETLCGSPGDMITPTRGIRGQWTHPLLSYVDWSEVHIARARDYVLPGDADVLLETATGPLLWILERPQQRVACMAFDLHDSDLPLRLGFPILTANLVGWLLPQTSMEPVLPLPAGYSWYPALPVGTTDAVLIAPDGARQRLSIDSPSADLQRAGLYRIEAETPAGTFVRYAALALLDDAETDLRPRELRVAGRTIPPISQEGPGWQDLSRWPLGAALLLLLVEAVLWWRPSFKLRGVGTLTASERRVISKWRGAWVNVRSRISFPMFLRLLLSVLLILALLGARISRRTRDLAVVFLLDRSDSTRAAWDAQTAFVEAALADKALQDRAALVVFGGDAWVDRPLSPAPELATIATLPRVNATNIEHAVRLGLALIPDSAPGRLVLLTDALETSGQGAWALREAAARNVDLLIVQSGTGTAGAEVWISDLRLPSRAYPGDRVPVLVEVQGNVRQPLLLTWTAAGQTGQVSFDLTNEVSTQAFSFSVGETGFVSLRACMEPESDTFLQNNCADGWLLVEGAPRVLVVGAPDERAALAQALLQAGLPVEQATPTELPLTATGLVEYAAVVLVNTPARAFAPQALTALRVFVRDLGGGLVAVGGPESYGVGGWLGTPLEEALPVEMRVQDPRRFSPLAMVIVIDKSGSMAVAEAGISKIRLAAEAAIRVAETLNDTDVLGVVAYDDRPADIFGPVSMTQRDALIVRLRRLQAGGGGIYVRESMDYAVNLLRGAELVPGTQRHILLLADGSDAEHQGGVLPFVADLIEDGMTVSVVSIGVGSDVAFLTQVAEAGEGRFYLTQRAADLPAIFAEEAARAKRSYIVEELFYPAAVSSWAPVGDIAATPPLRGYVATTPKGAAQVVWEATQHDPLLAVWQYGLGRSVAWTSDATGRWAAGWITWDAFANFWSAVVRNVLPLPSDTGVAMRVFSEGDAARVVVDISASEGGYVNDLAMYLHVAQPGSDADPQTVELHQVAPGRYEGRFALPKRSGALLLRLYGDRTLTSGWAAPASLEYIPGDAQAAVAQLIVQGNGREISDAGQVFVHDLSGREMGQPLAPLLLLFALFLWPVDIAWRRLSLTRADIVVAWGKLRARFDRRRSLAVDAPLDIAPTLAATLRQRTRQTKAPHSKEVPIPESSSAKKETPPVSSVMMPGLPETSTLDSRSGKNEPSPDADEETDTLAARLRRRIRD